MKTTLGDYVDTLVWLVCSALLGGLMVAGFVIATNNPASVDMTTVSPCQEEDGPGPCYWDASKRGNGLGQSFVIDKHGDVWVGDLADEIQHLN